MPEAIQQPESGGKPTPPWLRKKKNRTVPVDENGVTLEQPFTGYLVLEKIAQGGTAAIFRAEESLFGREVAIKALIPDLERDEDAVELFFNEARNVARLRHPDIVRGLDVGRAGKYFYFVMEYIKGESLAARLERLERGRLTEKDLMPILVHVTRALQYIFENGLVHRDVKPGNILLGADGTIKLCDLGVAREVAYSTAEDAVRGSPSYASPEQIRGDFNIDIRADLYGLGCTWYHALLGRPPFRGVNNQAILQKHLEEDAPNPREEDIRIGAATSQLILWLLRKDRDERPRTPQDFLRKLQEHPAFPDELLKDPTTNVDTEMDTETDDNGDD